MPSTVDLGSRISANNVTDSNRPSSRGMRKAFTVLFRADLQQREKYSHVRRNGLRADLLRTSLSQIVINGHESRGNISRKFPLARLHPCSTVESANGGNFACKQTAT